MTNDSYARTAAGMFDTLNRRLTSVERRLPPPTYIPPPPAQYGGTTAARNTYFGVPSTDAERVALANQRVTWFNTSLGWEESYYAVTGLSGLTAIGLVTGTASGWYPITAGPRIMLVANATQSVTGSQNINTWADPGVGSSYRRGGTAWFVYSGANITIQQKGRYRIEWHTTVQPGGGSPLHYVNSNTQGNIGQNTHTLVGGISSISRIVVEDILLSPSEAVKSMNGSLGPYNLNENGNGTNPVFGAFQIVYLGPALVSE